VNWITRVLRVLLALVAIAYLPVVGAGQVTDTGVRARKEAYWINNDQVLFPGFDATRADAATISRSPQSVLYIWDERTRKATAHADIPESDYICYSNGYVSYAVRKEGKRYIREGKLGAETEREWSQPAARSKVDRNEIGCRDFDYSTADKIYPGFLFVPLLDGDGYYGWQKQESNVEALKSLMFYLAAGKGKKPVPLPILGAEKDRISYSEYLRAYVIEYTPSHRNEFSVGKVRILYTTGKVTEFVIPAGPWMQGSVGYVPAKGGIVMSSRAAGLKSRFDRGHAGLYLVRENKVEQLLSGFSGRPAVSPNGCKVAAVFDPMTGPGVRATLQIVDLCKKGKKMAIESSMSIESILDLFASDYSYKKTASSGELLQKYTSSAPGAKTGLLIS